MPHLQIICTSQSSVHKYENLKRKPYNCNAKIYFNRTCLTKQLIPEYARIRIPNTSRASKQIQHKISKIRIKDEIKYIYIKIQQLNQQSYHLHLILANTWNNTWPISKMQLKKN